MSSVLSVFNQTVTELLPASKPAQPKAERSEGFDRELKDAGRRLDKPRPSDDQPRTTSPPEKPDAAESSAKPEPVKETQPTDKPEENTQPRDEQPASVDETATEGVTTDTQVTPEAQPEQVQPAHEAAAAVAVTVTDQQLIEQVQVPAVAESVVQTDRAAQTNNAQVTQAVVDPSQIIAPAPSAAGEATPKQPANQAVQAVAQPQQVKQVQTQQAESTTQAEPSAAAQRITLVAESRQQDAGTSTTDDPGKQQQHGALKAESGAQPTANAAALTTNTTGAAPATHAAAGVQTIVSADSPAPVATNTVPAGPASQTQDADNTQLNTARIARGMQNAIQQKGGAVTLRLTPPQMGTVRIQLQIHNGTVNAQFHAETESTRMMLNQQLSQLRTALEQQGLNVERLGVQTMQQSHASSAQQQFQQNERDGQPNDGRSRGGFTQQDNRQGQRQASGEQQQSAFEQQMSTAA